MGRLLGVAPDRHRLQRAAGRPRRRCCVLCLTTGLGGVGFLDDFIKIRKQRNLGLNKRTKLIGQTFVALSFGICALQFRDAQRAHPGSTHLSYIRDMAWLSMGAIGFVILACICWSAPGRTR